MIIYKCAPRSLPPRYEYFFCPACFNPEDHIIARPPFQQFFDGASTPYPPPQNPKWCSLFNIYKRLQGKNVRNFRDNKPRILTKNRKTPVSAFYISTWDFLIGAVVNNRVFSLKLNRVDTSLNRLIKLQIIRDLSLSRASDLLEHLKLEHLKNFVQ